MYPILFTLGSFQVRSYNVFLLLGTVLGVLIASREAKRLGFSRHEIITFDCAVIPAAFLLGLLNGWLFDLEFYAVLARGKLHIPFTLVSFGIIFGALLTGWFFAKRRKKSVGQTLDLVTLSLPIILFFSRIGCLLNGCCYGRETGGFGGVYLPGPYGVWAYRYPTQIMLMILDLGLFIWLWSTRKKKLFEGSLTLLFLIAFSIGRSLIDALRDLPHVLGPFSLHQLNSLVILFVTIPIYFIQRRKTVHPSSVQ